jgi:hypothetical protein
MGNSTLNISNLIKGDTGPPGTSYGILSVYQVDHNFAVGNVLYRASGGYAKAIATSLQTAVVAGIVQAVADEDHFTLYLPGSLITTLSGLVDGTLYFVSETTAGVLTATAPDASSYIPALALVAISATSGLVLNQVVSTGCVLLLGEIRMTVGPTDPATLNTPSPGDLWVDTNP